MRLSELKCILILATLFSVAIIQSEAIAEDLGTSKGQVSFFLGRPTDLASNGGKNEHWFGALIDASLEFKGSMIDGFSFVPSDSVYKIYPHYKNLKKNITDQEYMVMAKKTSATHLGIQKYEIGTRQVMYYMEILSVADKKTIATIEKSFKLADAGVELNGVMEEILRIVGISPATEINRFLSIPIISSDIRLMKQTGAAIVLERFSNDPGKSGIDKEYRALCEKNSENLVALYRSSVVFENAKLFHDQAGVLNALFSIVPEYRPLYFPLASSYNQIGQYEDAIRIAILGEKRGVLDIQLQVQKALAYEKINRAGEALDVYQNILKNDSTNLSALEFFAKKYNEEKTPVKALIYAQKMARLQGGASIGYQEMGRSYILINKQDSAEIVLLKATDADPKNSIPKIYLADLYLKQQNFIKASRLYEKAITAHPDDIALHIKASQAFNSKGDIKHALSILEQLGKRYTNHGEIQKELGLLRFLSGDIEKSRPLLEASIRSGTEDERVLIALGNIYSLSGEFEKSFQMLQRALPMASNKDACRMELARLYIRKKEPSTAITTLESIDKKNVKNYNFLFADALLLKNEQSNALTYLKKERAAYGTSIELQKKIADISYQLGKQVEARIEYSSLVKLTSLDFEAFYRLTVLMLELKDKKTALGYLSRAEKMGKSDIETYFRIAKGLVTFREYSKAEQLLKECIAIDNKREDIWSVRVKVFESLNMDSAAAEGYSALYNIDSVTYKDAIAKAGRLFDKVGLEEKARSSYWAYFKNDPKNNEIALRLAVLEYKQKNYEKVVLLCKNIPLKTLHLSSNAQMIAHSLYMSGDYLNALTFFATVRKYKPNDLPALEYSAIAYEKTGDLKNAAVQYQNLVNVSPKSQKLQDISYHLGEIYEKLKDYKAATNCYLLNIKSYPDDLRNYEHVLNLLENANDWKLIVSIAEKALLLKNAPDRIRLQQARALVIVGNTERAIDSYGIYLKSESKDSLAWKELAEIRFKEKLYKDAAITYEKTVSLMPNCVECWTNLGISNYNTKDLSRAIQSLEKASNLSKNNLEIISLLAKCYREKPDVKKLKELLRSWFSFDKKNVAIRKELGALCIESGEYIDAAVVLESASILSPCDSEIHLQLASIFEKQGSSKRWGKQLQSALECSPKNGEFHFQLGRFYESQRETKKMEFHFQKTVELSPAHSEARYQLGVHLKNSGRLTDASKLLQSAVEIDPIKDKYRTVLAEVLYSKGEKQAALKIITPCIPMRSSNPEVLWIAGILYRENGITDTSKLVLEKAVIVDKNCGKCFGTLGKIYAEESDYKTAARHFQVALDIDGYNELLAFDLARCLTQIGRDDPAQKVYETILANNPKNGEAFYRIAHRNIIKNRIDDAKTFLSMHSQKKSGWHYILEAEIAESEKKMVPAFNSYSEALKTLSENPIALAGCARIALTSGKYDDAVMYFGRSMAGDPEDIELFIGIGKAYEALKDYTSALEFYEEASRINPDHQEVFLLMARVRSKKQNHLKAIETIKEGIAKNKKNALLYLSLGNEYRLTGIDKKAIAAYNKALQLDKKRCVEAYRHVGNIYYYNIKNSAKALKYYEKYVQMGGIDSNVKRILRKK